MIFVADAFISPSRIHTSKTLLKNKHTHIEYNDFASVGEHDIVEEKEALMLTKEFNEEVRLRGLTVDESETREVYTSSPSLQTKDGASPLFAFLSFLNPPPPPPSSAGLFSGRGQTAYSSGRSLRAEVQLQSSISKDSGARIIGWDGLYIDSQPDQIEQIFKAAAGTLIVLSVAYLATEITGGLTIVFPWEEAMAAGIAKNGITSVLIVLSDEVEHIGTVMTEESSALVGSVGQALARSMEELVLR